MNEYEVTCQSANTLNYSKKIFIYIVEPSIINDQTGIMHYAHGWGGNRYQYRDVQKEFADRYNLICIATEYRQSGYYFDPVTGTGADVPYDASHYQVIDCLNAVRKAISLYPSINRRRLISFGGSQGGHVAMLMSIFCPHTFAFVVSGSGISHADPKITGWAGRDFSADELAIRDVIRMAGRVQCPVALMHGTADTVVAVDHTRLLEKALRENGKTVRVKYVEGGGHALEPVTDRKTVTVELADDWLKSLVNQQANDFDSQSKIEIPCVTRKVVIDWSKPPADSALISWGAMDQ